MGERGMPTALLRYALRDVFRNRRRTLSSILGVLLAITFIAGTFIAIDSSTRATLYALLDQSPADFSFSAQGANTSLLRDDILAVSGVTDVALYQTLPVWEVGTEDSPYVAGATVAAIDPDHLPSNLRDAKVQGSLALPRGTVGISDSLASTLSVGMGDVIFLNVTTYDYNGTRTYRLNLTVVALLDIPADPYAGPFPYQQPWAVVHLRDAGWVMDQLAIDDLYSQIQGEIGIDRDGLIDPYDLQGSIRNLARIERQVQAILLPYGGWVNSNLRWRLESYGSIIGIQRVMYLALSMPVLLLGLYLGAVGVDLGHAERRRELAVLRTRGAGRRQVVGLLLLDAALGGVLAAVAGLGGGILLSRLLLSVVNPYATGATPRYEDLILSADTVLAVGILSVLLMALVSFRSARRTASLAIVETLRYHAPGETRIEYRPTIDAVLVGLATTTYVGVWYTRTGSMDMFAFLIGAIFVLLVPFAPVFLIIGSTRLLTRLTGRIYELASIAFRPVAKNLHHVISKNLARNPRRASNIAVIIALGLAFGLFVFSFYGSQQAYQRRVLWDSIGADVSARF